jgi:hypothetical protein
MAVFPTRVQRRAQKGRRPAVHLDAYS